MRSTMPPMHGGLSPLHAVSLYPCPCVAGIFTRQVGGLAKYAAINHLLEYFAANPLAFTSEADETPVDPIIRAPAVQKAWNSIRSSTAQKLLLMGEFAAARVRSHVEYRRIRGRDKGAGQAGCVGDRGTYKLKREAYLVAGHPPGACQPNILRWLTRDRRGRSSATLPLLAQLSHPTPIGSLQLRGAAHPSHCRCF
jgi:hypothetical protein